MPHKTLYLLVFAAFVSVFGGLAVAARVDVSDDAMAARKLVAGIEKHEHFRIEKCSRVGMAWIGFFLMKRPIHHRYEFARDCDVEGTVEITPEPFLVHFKVRNLGDVSDVTATAQVSVEMAGEGSATGLRLKFDFSNGELKNKSGAAILAFDGTYAWTLEKDAEAHHGQSGRLHISGYKGRPLDLNERLEPALFR